MENKENNQERRTRPYRVVIGKYEIRESVLYNAFLIVKDGLILDMCDTYEEAEERLKYYRNSTQDKKDIAIKALTETGLNLGAWHIQTKASETGFIMEMERKDGLKVIADCTGHIKAIGGALTLDITQMKGGKP